MNNNTLRKKSHFQVNLKRSVHVKFFFKKMVGRCAAFRFQGLVRFDKKNTH